MLSYDYIPSCPLKWLCCKLWPADTNVCMPECMYVYAVVEHSLKWVNNVVINNFPILSLAAHSINLDTDNFYFPASASDSDNSRSGNMRGREQRSVASCELYPYKCTSFPFDELSLTALSNAELMPEQKQKKMPIQQCKTSVVK
ncbi:unnamed protein product [Ceratitis capitata]|uniref:(Mediterranean fruit fly) hypothetical protein n=1 Tax=Ceratitis capitata TaxID=7213 RepID=A0A811VCW6_CERCA|nr:unnamed protein product [Ceratitis capitata]